MPSLYIVEKFQCSSDHPILWYFYAILVLIHISSFLSNTLKYYSLIDHHCKIMSESLFKIAFVGIVWCSCRVNLMESNARWFQAIFHWDIWPNFCISRNKRKVCCPIMYTDTIYYANILFIETATIEFSPNNEFYWIQWIMAKSISAIHMYYQ